MEQIARTKVTLCGEADSLGEENGGDTELRVRRLG